MPIYIEILTLFPQLFAPFAECGIIKRALEQKQLQLGITSLRDFGIGRYRAVDDTPYGGGAGMVLKADVLASALEAIAQKHALDKRQLWRVLLTPQGRIFNQPTAQGYANSSQVLTLICGRYEGFDERIRTQLVDEELSLGDFICQGGEAPSLAIIETVVRLVPGVLGNPDSTKEESFNNQLLEYPQYTRPEIFQGECVPDILLSGNHQQIRHWRRQQALQRTAQRRPDLLAEPPLTKAKKNKKHLPSSPPKCDKETMNSAGVPKARDPN